MSAPSLAVISDAMNPGATAFTCGKNISNTESIPAHWHKMCLRMHLRIQPERNGYYLGLTLIFLLAYSFATLLVKPITPAFAAL